MRTKNDEKQIEEMASWLWTNTCIACEETCDSVAEDLCKAGYRLIPEGAVILTKEEIAALNEYQKKHFTGGEPLEG